MSNSDLPFLGQGRIKPKSSSARVKPTPYEIAMLAATLSKGEDPEAHIPRACLLWDQAKGCLFVDE